MVRRENRLLLTWRGILSDWEVSKPITDEDGVSLVARQPERTVSNHRQQPCPMSLFSS